MPEFPRYFVKLRRGGFRGRLAYIRSDSQAASRTVFADGGEQDASFYPLDELLQEVARGKFKEIAAAEATAMIRGAANA